MKKVIFALLIILAAAAMLFYFDRMNNMTDKVTKSDDMPQVNEADRRAIPTNDLIEKKPENPITFTGKLSKVDTGCFADGECYVEVDGKHVTVLMGWSRDTVGRVIGGDGSIGGLEMYIGKNVEVKANKLDDKNYTLYGDTGYYVKVK